MTEPVTKWPSTKGQLEQLTRVRLPLVPYLVFWIKCSGEFKVGALGKVKTVLQVDLFRPYYKQT